jgi:hypothetical protein
MLAITDASHQAALAESARAAGKLARDSPFANPANKPDALSARLAPHRRSGALPDFPMGSDFTDVEQRLVRALGWLKPRASGLGKLTLLLRALVGAGAGDPDAMARMGLEAPRGLAARVEALVLALALRETASSRHGPGVD